MEREQLILTNPFAGSDTVIVKCKDENRIDAEAMNLLICDNEIEDYNEFYILFTNGTLIKRGRTKIKTSDYLKNKE
jgi:hypothetical protein